MSEQCITSDAASPRLFGGPLPSEPSLTPKQFAPAAPNASKHRSVSGQNSPARKKNLIQAVILILVLSITLPVSAGDYKWHKPWPSKSIYAWQDVTIIDVVLDLGYYIHIKNQDDIKVAQASVNGSNPFFTYFGCALTDVVSNFPATIMGTVKATSVAQGHWSATFNGQSELSLNANVTSVQICVLGENVATHLLIGPEAKENVKVAELTINVIPDGL